MNRDRKKRLESAKADHRAGRADAAEPVYRQLIAEDPNDAEAHHMVAIVHLQKRAFEAAVASARKAAAIENQNPQFLNTLGAALLEAGELGEAERALNDALSSDPGFVDASYNLGSVLKLGGRDREAIEAFERVLTAEPDHGDALNNIGATLMDTGRRAEAIAHLERAHLLDTHNPVVMRNLADCLERLNRIDEAWEIARKLEKIQPNQPLNQIVLAKVERRLGRLEEAAARLQAVCGRNAEGPTAIRAAFDLGQTLDRLELTDEAFAAFSDGNARQLAAHGAFDADDNAYIRRLRDCREWATPETISALGQNAPAAESGPATPVFMVGFPRSGTTLLERMLDTHPETLATGEMSPIDTLVKRLVEKGNYPSCLSGLTAGEIKDLRAEYWRGIEAITGENPKTRRTIDKLPMNIVNMGLIWTLFPDAKVIVSLRDPRDACLSSFMQQFVIGDVMVHFTGLRTTVRLYREVMGLWLRYRAFDLSMWLEVPYERLIGDYQETVRGIVDFIGLEWHDAILDYRQSARATNISTPSYEGVSEKLYRRAIGRWRRYGAQMSPFLADLAPFAEAFGYEPE